MFSVQNKRILFVAWAARGDFNPLFNLAVELQKRGAIIVFASDEEAREWVANEPGMEFLSLGPFPTTKYGQGDIEKIFSNPEFLKLDDMQRLGYVFTEVMPTMYEKSFAILREYFASNRPALVVAHSGTLAPVDVAKEFNVPAVMINPMAAYFDPLSLRFPAKWSGYPLVMTWSQFFISLWWHFRGIKIAITGAMRIDKIRKKFGNNNSVMEIFANTRCIMTSIPGLSFPLQIPQHLNLVGPLLSETKERMSNELEKWLEDQKNVIYVSFGTSGKPPPELWEKIISGLKKAGYSVLISARDDTHKILTSQIGNDSKFFLQHWVPQKLVLQHPSVKVFVSHCGFGSACEGIYYCKPILAIPFLFDQPDVAARLEDCKIGISVNRLTCTPDEICDKLQTLVLDKSYATNVAKMALVMRTAGGVKKAADICEEEMFCGSSHLHVVRPPSFPFLKVFAFVTFISGCFFLFFNKNHLPRFSISSISSVKELIGAFSNPAK